MMPYEIEKDCRYGSFNLDKHAGYTLTAGDKLKGPWYYIYQNRKILLYVDQNGPVKIMYEPPHGILIIKREIGETESKWQVWVQSDSVNDGIPVSNFNSPKLAFNGEKPKFWADWTPETATYHAEYKNMEIVTEIFVPQDKATVSMKTTIKNTGSKTSDYVVTPALFPYINIPQMVAWDLPEWYLASKITRNGEKAISIHGQMSDPHMDPKAYRSVTFNMDYDENATMDLYAHNFGKTGNFFNPDAIRTPEIPFTYAMKDIETTKYHSSKQQTYCARYKCTLAPGESKTYTQVLTVQDAYRYDAEAEKFEQNYFDDAKYNAHKQETVEWFNKWFDIRSVKTANPLFDNFANTFAPLQMYWTCSLDRGWPSSMRGIRDASQDFCGMTPLDPKWTRETIISMFEHQQFDGWMPRQISTVSREAPHDMRYYCDGGAFLIELIHEYITYTRDTSLFNEKIWWLDNDQQDTILEHIVRCIDFYLDEKNIGEHDLCKVWFGDWWDPMDKIGMEGIGETVTVTAQMVLALKNMADMFTHYKDIIPEKYHALPEKYMAYRERFIKGMQKTAFNKEGFFQGYMNDDRKWLFADAENDAEGISKLYLVSNAWAIISASGTPEMSKSAQKKIEEMNFGRIGYNTKSIGYATPIQKGGRVGIQGPGTAPYNHAQSFYVRACCTLGDSETAYKATHYIFPFEEKYAPTDFTYAPPYAIANGYSNSDMFLHWVGFQFLSGTVSYTLRIIYNFFFGITYDYDGLKIRPCLPKEFGNCSVKFNYLGKKFTMNFTQGENKSVKLNGADWSKTKYDTEYRKDVTFIADGDMKDENVIDIVY